MEDRLTFILLIYMVFIGALFGYNYGEAEAKQAIAECEKELPRYMHCKIVGVAISKD